ncbi:UNKNOWN [Stylonychia lemnae]|uniref:C3H1-type domain-containing protein n=1 Tax=Stylonychia lemnae TaxID=5949 RepID=A0A077ZXN2_STYLE|nr:UNKNOWN [Stylonychia lemnae]|eukprot:CDW74676.1 UNKNOWN [Stylonychia lemnae]
MVEASQNYDDFERVPVCRVYERMGVCLEPAVCQYTHPTYLVQTLSDQQVAGSQLNLNAVEFKPKKKNVEVSQEEAIYAKFEKMEDIYYFESSKSCPCCKGQVNNCNGDACQNLGICYCVVHLSHSE